MIYVQYAETAYQAVPFSFFFLPPPRKSFFLKHAESYALGSGKLWNL